MSYEQPQYTLPDQYVVVTALTAPHVVSRCGGTDAVSLHQKEMEKAAEEARKKYEEDHPEAAGLKLKFDPRQHIEDARSE